MKLKALDQLHVSAVKSDTLRPGEEFEVSDEMGADLLKRHPAILRRLDPPPAAKAEAPPKNKSDTRRKTKSAPARRA